jgi:hypothetical protein
MIGEKMKWAEPKIPSDIKTPSVLNFLSEGIENYFSKLKFSFYYENLNTIGMPPELIEQLKKIDQKYIVLLIAELAKISIFKLFEKKSYRNSRLMVLSALLKDLSIEFSVSSEKKLQNTYSLHCFIFSLIHFDQPEILAHLFKFDFFRAYIKELKPALFNPDFDAENMFVHALCRNSIQVIKIFQEAGWKASVEDVKMAISYHAEKSIEYLLGTNTYDRKEKIIFVTFAISKSNLIIPELIEPGANKKFFLNYGFNLIGSSNPWKEEREKYLFYGMLALYRFNLDIAKTDEAGQSLEECVRQFVTEHSEFKKFANEHPEFKMNAEDVSTTLNYAKTSYRIYASQLAPGMRGSDEQKELLAFYQKTEKFDFEKERQYALTKAEIAKKLACRGYDQDYLKKNNLPFPNYAPPKNFKYKVKDLLWIVCKELGQYIGNKDSPSARSIQKLNKSTGTPVCFNRYAPGFHFIEAMLNIDDESDIIQTETGYGVLHKKKIISEVTINPANQDLKDADFSFLKSDLSPEALEEVKIKNKAIFELDSKELRKDQKPLTRLLHDMLKKARLFQPIPDPQIEASRQMVLTAQAMLIRWLALIYNYHHLSSDDYYQALSFFIIQGIPPESLKSLIPDAFYKASLHYLRSGFMCLHGQQSLEEMKEIEELNREIFDMDSEIANSQPELFYGKIAEFLALTGQLTPIPRLTGSALEIWLAAVHIHHRLNLIIIKKIQLDLFDILVSKSIAKKLFLHLFHPETLSDAARKYVETSKKDPKIQRLLAKFKLNETPIPEEKFEPIVLSELECLDEFLKQDLIPHNAVDKQGQDLRKWAAAHGRTDISDHLKEKNPQNSPTPKTKQSVHPSITFKYLQWGLEPPQINQASSGTSMSL